ncbi:MAG: NAD(+) diphosphatase [Candidatus Nanopelagicales bacterium]
MSSPNPVAGIALALGHQSLDRRPDLRRAGWEALRGMPRLDMLIGTGGEAAAVRTRDGWALASVQAEAAGPVRLQVLLGVDPDGVARCAHLVDPSEPLAGAGDAGLGRRPDAERIEWVGLRSAGPRMSALDRELFAEALALVNWHRSHPRCPRCGSATDVAGLGWWRTCPVDGSEHYPRTDPAVIALLVDHDGNALFGRQVRWPQHAFSTLAGFVEPGESAEAAVVREISEEVGLRPSGCVYVGSQPWPFPGSLMLGFQASVEDVRPSPVVDGIEIAEARWLSRAELTGACQRGDVRLPGRLSIAHNLIVRWYGAALPDEWCRW